MDTQTFLQQLKEVLEIEDRELSLNDKFKEYDEWDSMAYLSTIAMIDVEYGVVISAAEFRQLNTVDDIVKAIEAKK